MRCDSRRKRVSLEIFITAVTTIDRAYMSGQYDHRDQLSQAALRVYHLDGRAGRGERRHCQTARMPTAYFPGMAWERKGLKH